MTRLDSVFPGLVERLRHAAASKQRAAALAACRYAFARADVTQVAAINALEAMQTLEALSGQQKSMLSDLASQLDEEYFRLQEAADEGRSPTDDYLKFFAQARAVAALAFAAGDDPFTAAAETIYEASATADYNERMLALVEAEL